MLGWLTAGLILLLVISIVLLVHSDRNHERCPHCNKNSGHEISRERTGISTYKRDEVRIEQRAKTWGREHFLVKYECRACEQPFEKEVAITI